MTALLSTQTRYGTFADLALLCPAALRIKEPSPVATGGDADVLEVIVRQPQQQVRVDLIVSEIRLELAEPETAKPPQDVHARASYGLTDNP
jgi:hypothetical protein